MASPPPGPPPDHNKNNNNNNNKSNNSNKLPPRHPKHKSQDSFLNPYRSSSLSNNPSSSPPPPISSTSFHTIESPSPLSTMSSRKHAASNNNNNNNSNNADSSSNNASGSQQQNHRRGSTDESFESLEDFMNKDDIAERGLLQSMEQRRDKYQTSGGESWHASCDGERPPLGGAVPLETMYSALQPHHPYVSNSTRERRPSESGNSEGSHTSQGSASKLADIARKMRQKAAAAATPAGGSGGGGGGGGGGSGTAPAGADSTVSSNTSALSHGGHRRVTSTLHAILDSIQEQPEESNEEGGVFETVGGGGGNDPSDGGTFGSENTNTDRLLSGAMQVEDLFDESAAQNQDYYEEEEEMEGMELEDGHEMVEGRDNVEFATGPHGETLPLTANNYLGDRRYSTAGGSHDGSRVSSYKSPHSGKTFSKKIIKKKQRWYHKCAWGLCHPWDVMKWFALFMWHQTYILTVCFPCFFLAWFLYYYLFNPSWNFLPGRATLAWWMNFVGRQVLLLEVSRLLQWIVIDNLVLGTRIAVQCLGPLLTLCFIQARGWPFCVSMWGFLDLMLLEGGSEFERHWLFFTSIKLYSQGNSGSYVLTSEFYVRLLLSFIVAGVATAGKRTAVAMYFGRRTFVEFKPRLEKLLKEVVLVSELAALAEEAEIAALEELPEVPAAPKSRDGKVKFLGDVSWTSRKKLKDAQAGSRRASAQSAPLGASEDVSDSDEDEDDDGDDDASDVTSPPSQNEFSHVDSDGKRGSRNFFRRDSSGSLRVKDLLDHWEEPVNRLDKSMNASISDILRFRRALTFMDDERPFGEMFGPASTREQMVQSAHHVYERLLKLTPGKSKLSCEFYDMLALEENGVTVNHNKLKALRKLFRPDANNELGLLPFVQCCDALYKKLRYFRANVGNASVIDNALESICDGTFTFVLMLVILAVLRFNPWPLLVSLSTLLVSISFAVGSSASKFIEGILLVAARRPFDLGDRIYMENPSVLIMDGLWYCWFVEDINLFHTTIRYAGTNEVATINNGSIAGMRIMNGARSPNALVWFQFPYRPTLMENGNFEKLRSAMEAYCREHPRSWHSFSYMRVDEVHPHLEKLVVTFCCQHRTSWQDLVGILEAKAALMCWTLEYGRNLGVNYDELPRRDLMYFAGSLKDGEVHDHRFKLHENSNITNSGFPMRHFPEVTPESTRSPGEVTSPQNSFLARVKQSHQDTGSRVGT